VPLLALRAADFGYAGRAIVRGASLEVHAAELVLVAGANGSGKTTLARGLLGLIAPLAGGVERKPGLRIGYVPQRETLDPLYPLSALDVAAMGAWRDLPWWRFSAARARERGAIALASCSADRFAGERYASLSGGQRQRVLLARALASDPEWLVLDEPTAGVDAETERAIAELLATLCRERGIAVWLITHQLASVAAHATRRVSIDNGSVQEGSPC
jgi:ABC-type Mn2+/Zn2+ transport system ATPase subunit